MELLANELSVHGQFQTLGEFRAALARLMKMRATALRFGREVYCTRAFLQTRAVRNHPMVRSLQQLAVDDRRVVMHWLTRGGPFWDDLRQHGGSDWLECRCEPVTDSAVGEAAYRALHGFACGLVSATPSDWDFSPVDVTWWQGVGVPDRRVALDNFRDEVALEQTLRAVASPIRSWDELRSSVSTRQFEHLAFAEDCFGYLDGVPFARGAAERFLVLLDILNRLAGAGIGSPEGKRILSRHFMGPRALFSDSSDSEKQEFRTKLTFPHPDASGAQLFCTWHGKVSHQTLRLHYWWSGSADDQAYVVYAGPKITKR